jgi:predicted aspartyl protease
VYVKKSRTTVDLKQNIREVVAAISPTMPQQVMQNSQKHLGEFVDKKGCHLTDPIFRK